MPPRGRSNHKNAHLDAYTRHRVQYDRLCAAQGSAHLLDCLRAVAPWRGADVVDVGTGSGKLAMLLAPAARSVVGVDRQHEILELARARAREADARHVRFLEGDCCTLPLPSASADLAVAGWALCYIKAEHETIDAAGLAHGPWREHLDLALRELSRVLRPGGVAMIIESLGTGVCAPAREGSKYYAHLAARGFARLGSHVRTDYVFGSEQEARELLTFFYGGKTAARGVAAGRPAELGSHGFVVPECTGVWWWRKPRSNLAAAAPARMQGGQQGRDAGVGLRALDALVADCALGAVSSSR